MSNARDIIIRPIITEKTMKLMDTDNKITFAVAKGANAGTLVREIAAVAGGKGGGKPDQAMAGIPDASKIKDALAAAADIAAKYIK